MDTAKYIINLANRGTDLQQEVLFANFNQDCTSIAMTTKKGFSIYALDSIENVKLLYDNKVTYTEICLFERLFSSALVVFTSLKSPRKLRVYNFKKEKEILCNLNYSDYILAVKMNRLTLIVVLEKTIFIHSVKEMKLLHTITDTPSNHRGLCCLSFNNEHLEQYFAYPECNVSGVVKLFNVKTLSNIKIIEAHKSPLAAMNFNSTANMIATASNKGTVIRVFSIPDGQKLFECRRGYMQFASIGTLAFSPDSSLLLVSSNTETIHIFKLDIDINISIHQSESSSWTSYLTSFAPTIIADALYQSRDHATVKLEISNLKKVCAIKAIQNVLYVIVVDEMGELYIYKLPNEGGVCSLAQQHSLHVEASTTSDEIVNIDAVDSSDENNDES